jgi:hypothetical protein
MPTRIKLTAIRAALATKLASINGAGGGYTNTLTATDAVKAGLRANPWMTTACLCYGLDTEGRVKGPTFPTHTRSAVFRLNGWVPTTLTDPATRHDAACSMYEDLGILFSVSANRTLGITGVEDVDLRLDGTGNVDQTDTGSVPCVSMTITVTYREITG